VKLFQFVCFETPQPRHAFLASWVPFAAGFLARGLERIVLSERSGPSGFAFVSRNAWPEDRFAQAFRDQLPADAGGGSVRAVQGGAFRLAASAGVDPLIVDPTPKLVVFLEDVSASALWSSAMSPDARWARYERAPGVRGGRFAAVLELYTPSSLALREPGATPMCEVLSLPER
jgi:hypothetical protein